MSKHESAPPERLRVAGATKFERRLLDAAGRERPSPDLSERMARAIGVSIAAPGSAPTETATTNTQVVEAAKASSSLLPWISGALVAVGLAVGAFVATRPDAKPAVQLSVTSAALSESAAAPLPTTSVLAPLVPQATESLPGVSDEPPLKPALPSTRGRRGTTAGELANQIALVDAARSALTGGDAQRALAIVKEYQSAYPTGTFRPEVSAVKIEALVKLGRMTEARTLAERFVVAYGQGPLAARVARLAHIAQP